MLQTATLATPGMQQLLVRDTGAEFVLFVNLDSRAWNRKTYFVNLAKGIQGYDNVKLRRIAKHVIVAVQCAERDVPMKKHNVRQQHDLKSSTVVTVIVAWVL